MLGFLTSTVTRPTFVRPPTRISMSSPTPISTPVPMPASGGIPIVSDAVRLLRVLISPGAVFAEIEQRPTFWGPWAVIAVFNIVLNYLQQPFQQRVAQMMTERARSEERRV